MFSNTHYLFFLQDFSLHFHAVQQILESDQSEADPTQRTIIGLSPPIYNKQQSDVTINVHHWLNHVRLSQNVIDSILKTNIRTKAAIKARLVCKGLANYF